MPTFSPALEQSIKRAAAIAAERGGEGAVVEHLLLALVDDPDAARVMAACGIDLGRLREVVSAALPAGNAGAGAAGVAPERSKSFQSVLQRATIHAQSCGVQEVNGADVLVELFSSPAAVFLEQQGMTRFDAVSFVSHGVVGGAAAEVEGGAPPHSDEAAEAPLLRVLLMNDNYTPMEFVVHVLEHFFAMDRETATRAMLHVHQSGMGECGVYPADEARSKARQVLDFARAHQHPLRCLVSPQRSATATSSPAAP
jgi:ATP-dependent Clp protease adapter protein ClpS